MVEFCSNFADAVADIPDGAGIALHSWGLAGAPQNLIRAMRDQGAVDLTVITENFVYLPFPEEMLVSVQALMPQTKKIIAGFFGSAGRYASGLPDWYLKKEKEVEIEVPGHGNFINMLRAGGAALGPFYSPVGADTFMAETRETRYFNGKKHILLDALRPDYAFIRADKADRHGNLVYKGNCRSGNPVMAVAAKTTIVEVDEIVEAGDLHHESIVTPGAFVDRIVVNEPGAPGSYDYTMKVLHHMLSDEQTRVAILGKSKKMEMKEKSV